ncbi:MAG: acyl-CoA/acyl-ACP dehydrogenase [Gammaproteobacteria bacterium]|nr:acyl-CoA/acyl-ACP dehydrogenase [Gammaproteobacteria bacterium]MBT8151906.1 acyl-CoA/acyl-ACP dehydrogenase [Gammaproteobacteria bacterium]NND39238.1 acyl-CoA/acyl-ACP dehydrogenase [Pseudomonadales bacterium]NNM11273.1 acyl-CoA/acyl-ACP dehydrogenase [Pseudomonadales bacterium]RZV60038.1 MAG: acyl-CoA dehydrogenase [Pseudomonadales bacterium]
MDFTFNQDQMAFRDSLASMLADAVSSESIRARWQTQSGFNRDTWQQLAEMGITGMLVPVAVGGMQMDEVDFVMLAEECGRVALPEPLVDIAQVSTRMLAELVQANPAFAEQGNALLAQLADGSALVIAGHMINPYQNFASEADYFLLPHGEEVHLLSRDQVSLTAHKSLDPSRRLARIEWTPAAETRIVDGQQGALLWRAALNRGALGAAAQMLGLAQAMLAQTVQYSCDREQFGKAIGSNQAVKHLLADCAVRIEFARPVVYRAAYTTSVEPQRADCAVSHAKTAAASAALLCARHCTQVHGAMGYTWECDLHIWAKRSWALDKNWGDEGFHKNRIHEWLLNPRALFGAEYTFGASNTAFDLGLESGKPEEVCA